MDAKILKVIMEDYELSQETKLRIIKDMLEIRVYNKIINAFKGGDEKMNEIDLSKFCGWERKKAIFLLGLAESLGMNTSDYGELAVNEHSGYTYLWLENYSFTLYMPIDCELQKSDVWAMWTNTDDGEEREMQLTEQTTLKDLEDWAEEQEKSRTLGEVENDEL